MKTYGYTIPAGGSQLIQRPGAYIRGLSGALPYEIQLDDGPATGFETGIGINESFEYVRITNTASSPQFIEVAISYGEVDDNRLVGGAIAPKPGETLSSVGTFAGGETIPANQDRRQLVMRFDINNAQALSIGGLPFMGGDAFELDITGAVDVTGDAGDLVHVAEVI